MSLEHCLQWGVRMVTWGCARRWLASGCCSFDRVGPAGWLRPLLEVSLATPAWPLPDSDREVLKAGLQMRGWGARWAAAVCTCRP